MSTRSAPRSSAATAGAAVVRVDPADGIDVVHDDPRRTAALQDDGLGEAWVTGSDARTVDLSDSLLGSAPWAALIIALGTVVLLFLMTGSLVVPLKALVASALSLGASIGVLVWGFEQGNFARSWASTPRTCTASTCWCCC